MSDCGVGTLAPGVDFRCCQSGTGRMDTQNTLMEQIARRHLGLETLETRHSDRLDFHDLAVWSIEAALKAAFDAGQKAVQAGR